MATSEEFSRLPLILSIISSRFCDETTEVLASETASLAPWSPLLTFFLPLICLVCVSFFELRGGEREVCEKGGRETASKRSEATMLHEQRRLQ